MTQTDFAVPRIPRRMLKWNFYGEGYESLVVEEAPVPEHGADELLVRQDACGLCFSDTKVIALGANHPRMSGRNLRTNPVTLGHEVSCTVVSVGAGLHDRFKNGDRFIVQADVFYQGVSMAYGYSISGGLAEYSIIPKAMIDGDEGCYLLPIRPDAGYVETALVEPWACVVSAYAQAHRNGLEPGGYLLVVGTEEAANIGFDFTGTFRFGGCPQKMFLVGVKGNPDRILHGYARNFGIECKSSTDEVIEWDYIKEYETSNHGFDDIWVLGAEDHEILGDIAKSLADHGVLNMIGGAPLKHKVNVDIGRVHYNWHHYVGTPTNRPANGYAATRTAELTAGGICWFIGAGGPMGQMHVQRAVQLSNPPKRILATDIDAERLQSVADRFGATARERGVELITINPNNLSKEQFDTELHRLSDERGFDDIVSLVPVATLIEHAAEYLADGGWFNLFAGVARGTMAHLDLDAVVRRGVRYLGSSGSSIADMRQTLEKVESHELSTNMSLAAIGGMKAAREGIEAVKEGRFPGKTLIFPHIPDLPLTPLPELKQVYPSVFAKLKEGQFWTKGAEEELLKVTSKA